MKIDEDEHENDVYVDEDAYSVDDDALYFQQKSLDTCTKKKKCQIYMALLICM